MSVFLRWGVFGILAVAGLLYAYNASRRLAEIRGAETPAISADSSDPIGPPTDGQSTEPQVPVPERCEQELRVAERALEARRQEEPLDKLLRVQLIAFENDSVRRARLEKVATDWYLMEGDEPSRSLLRSEVVADCERFNPAP
jgi:hypothetical protein